MPRRVRQSRSAHGPPRRRRTNGQSARLLRHSHIFASAVRDILELEALRGVSSGTLTLTQLHLVKLMTLRGGRQIHEVAQFLGVSPPAATKNIDKLESLGLVARRHSEGDRRAILLSVSPKGRALVRRYEKARADLLSPALEQLSPTEIDELAVLLERFSIALLALDRRGHEFCLRCAAYLERGCPVSAVRGGCPYKALGSER